MRGRWVGSLLTVSLLLGMGSLSSWVGAETVLVQGRMSEREVEQLLEQGFQQTQQGQPMQAIETFERVLVAARQWQARQLEATALLGIGRNYEQIGQRQQALEFYRQTLILFRETNARLGESATLNNIGAVYNTLGNRTEALNYFNQALPITREVGDLPMEATTLNNIGGVYDALGNRTEALNYFNQALQIFQEVGNRSGEATTLHNIGGVYDALGKRTEALNYFNQALQILREVGNRSGEATTLNNIGLVYHNLGNRTEALNYYNQALLITREVGDRSGEATTLNNIGLAYNALGKRTEALNYYNQALPILQEVGNRSGEATTLNNMGGVYDTLGNRTEALNYYNQALPITQEVGDRSGEATTLNNIGLVYNALGKRTKALNYYNQALPILQEVDNRSGEAATLNNIGVVYNALGNGTEALNYYNQALLITREVGDRSGEATTLNNIGRVYHTLGNGTVALVYYSQALSITREVGDLSGEATTLNNIGGVYNDLGKRTEALNYYNQALPILREVGDRSGEADTLNNIAFVYRDTNQPDKAITYWEDSLNILLELRGELQKEFRETFLQTNRGRAVALVDLLIDQNQPQRAFEWANRVTTYELADYNRLIGVRVANPETQTALDDWNNQHQQIQALRQQLQDNFSTDLVDQLRNLETQVNQQAETLANTHPEIAELFEIQPEDLSQLQASLPPGTVVLQPVLLTNIQNVPDTIALFLLSRDSLSVKKVPINGDEFNESVKNYRQMLQSYNSGYLPLANTLYDHLIRPVAPEIEALNPQQLAIIATGPLRQFPFETLRDSQTDTFLLQQYPIHYLTRLSSRSLLANPTAPITLPLWTIPLLLTIIGIGATAKHQWKLGGTLLTAALITSTLTPRLTPNHRILGFANPKPQDPFDLPGTEAEVDALLQLAPTSEIYRHQQATLEQFKRQSPRHRYLHLATHGCFQQLGCCLQETCPDYQPDMKANTLLFADQEYPLADAALLGLQNTELVALTACQTALQTNIDGDAIMGMAYIWERAGAKALMATLWNVDDEITAAITTEFYRLIIEEKLSKAEALQQAKLSLKDFDRHHPYLWSPLILIGDPR
ncbi:tetratricopeptide repeat protein [Spirulina sp. CCNP1310]|uniref:CHAT domain-containing protein n=1 Tax=Spirulina sp. CCNP1310 TaxID=3110249 RepID=UPI002B21B1F6|nr:tetratricopeptide repeat protein [Spirulina sp. CCNP1310]MEA5417674.1 tetratricopeptide repeat protein [Spirulina sp. CCNP1310]